MKILNNIEFNSIFFFLRAKKKKKSKLQRFYSFVQKEKKENKYS